MYEWKQYRLFGAGQGDCSFLKKVGIKPCVIVDPIPEPLPVPMRKDRSPRPTEKDTEWLRDCGVAWEQKPAVQIPLDFTDCRKKEPDPAVPASQTKEELA